MLAFFGKIFKIVLWMFSLSHWSRCCVQILWNLADGKSLKSCVVYLTKKNKISSGSPAVASCRYCADRAQNLPGPALDNVLRVLQISSKSVYFWLSYSWTRDIAKLQRKVNPIFGRSLASSRIIMFDKWKIQWTVLCGSCCNAVQLPIMSPRRWTRHCLWTALLMPWN